MDDIKIIDLFFARSELAIEALDGKYGAICHNLSRSILKDQQDAEECVNDAYLGVWNAIPPHRLIRWLHLFVNLFGIFLSCVIGPIQLSSETAITT